MGLRWSLPPVVQRIAAAGNTAAVLVLLFVAVLWPFFVSKQGSAEDPPAPSLPPERSGGAADCAVLLVIDGLRANTACDARVMPFLQHLGDAEGRTVAHVEALVPSSIAALITLTTKEVPPLTSFLQDFGAHPFPRGGIFADVAAAGGRSFVAGPALWTDLFGPWIHDAQVDTSFGQQDAPLLEAGCAALRSRHYRLVVVHLQRVDAAAHRFGAASARYAEAAHWCDAAVAVLHASLSAGDCLLVTSDHGNIDAGGHAGREAVVVQTPVVTAGQGLPRGHFHDLRQRDIPELLRRALALKPDPSPDPEPDGGGGRPEPVSLLLGGLALCGAVRVWAGVAGPTHGARQAFWLNLSLWIALVLLLLGWSQAALLGLLATLLAMAGLTPLGAWKGILATLAVGGLLGGVRLVPGCWLAIESEFVGRAVPGAALALLLLVLQLTRQRGSSPPFSWRREGILLLAGASVGLVLGGAALAAAFLAAWATGRLLAAWPGCAGGRLLALGALAGMAPVMCDALRGRTVSLSTIDVRAAFTVVELPGGIGLAGVLVMLGEIVPFAGLLLGLSPLVWRQGAVGMGRVAAGLATVLAGQAAAMTFLLAWQRSPPDLLAAALGGLLQVSTEIVTRFVLLAGLCLVGRWQRGSVPPADSPQGLWE